MYKSPDVGIEALLSDTINVIQQCSLSLAGSEDVALVDQRLESASENWLNATIINLSTCQGNLYSQINTNAGSLIRYQFGDALLKDRIDWISFWRCSGATFGCAGLDIETCPQADSCFAHLHQTFAPVLNFPGGVTALGNNKSSIMGRFTPQYSPSFIASELVTTIDLLTQWSATMQSFEQYVALAQKISLSAKQQMSFTQAAINITLQVEAVSASTSLQSNYILGKFARFSKPVHFAIDVRLY
jgi:hypothetical protein